MWPVCFSLKHTTPAWVKSIFLIQTRNKLQEYFRCPEMNVFNLKAACCDKHVKLSCRVFYWKLIILNALRYVDKSNRINSKRLFNLSLEADTFYPHVFPWTSRIYEYSNSSSRFISILIVINCMKVSSL